MALIRGMTLDGTLPVEALPVAIEIVLREDGADVETERRMLLPIDLAQAPTFRQSIGGGRTQIYRRTDLRTSEGLVVYLRVRPPAVRPGRVNDRMSTGTA